MNMGSMHKSRVKDCFLNIMNTMNTTILTYCFWHTILLEVCITNILMLKLNK